MDERLASPMVKHAGHDMQASNAPANRSSDVAGHLIAELKHKYIWWKPVGEESPPECRIIAQAMNLGTFDDIRRMEKTLGPERLAEVMMQAQPGWIGDRSWEFWRGRLSRILGRAMPEEAPRRSFRVEVL